jgi:hypothetical protein
MIIPQLNTVRIYSINQIDLQPYDGAQKTTDIALAVHGNVDMIENRQR